jgi:probable rRNA maturation factor
MAEEAEQNVRGEINLIFTNDVEIRKLNKTFRRKDKSTDVLSFNIDKPISAELTLGEIYISVNTAVRQARAFKVTLGEELLRLFCHGLLHLLGYDHIKANERLKMEKREKYFLELV